MDANNTFSDILEQKLLDNSNIVSSVDTDLTKAIEDAIAGKREAGAASAQAIESSANREIAFQKEQFGQARTSELEGGRGFAVNNAALKALDDRTEKSLRDLEQRKQELLLQNKAESASQIADLQFQALQFQQQASQTAFTNMLNIGQFQLQKDAQRIASSQFKQDFEFRKAQNEFDNNAKIAEIASEWGVSVDKGETLTSIVNKVKPFASAKRSAELSVLVKEAQSKSTEIDLSNLINEAITGTGQFAEDGPMSPDLAAITAANYIKSIGITPTKEDLKRFQDQAVKSKKEYDTKLDQTVAEQTGQNFWNIFGGIFGQSNVPSAQLKASSKIESERKARIDSALGRDSGNAVLSTFEDLFGQ